MSQHNTQTLSSRRDPSLGDLYRRPQMLLIHLVTHSIDGQDSTAQSIQVLQSIL